MEFLFSIKIITHDDTDMHYSWLDSITLMKRASLMIAKLHLKGIYDYSFLVTITTKLDNNINFHR